MNGPIDKPGGMGICDGKVLLFVVDSDPFWCFSIINSISDFSPFGRRFEPWTTGRVSFNASGSLSYRNYKTFCVTLIDFLPLIKQVTQFSKKGDLFINGTQIPTSLSEHKNCIKKVLILQEEESKWECFVLNMEPQFSTIYYSPPKSQMHGLTFHCFQRWFSVQNNPLRVPSDCYCCKYYFVHSTISFHKLINTLFSSLYHSLHAFLVGLLF